MLANLIADFKNTAGHTLHQAKNIPDIANVANSLGPEDSAQFSAGFLYGWSLHTIEKRDYIVGCANQNRVADWQLNEGMNKYIEGDIDSGNWFMDGYLPWTRWAMRSCDETDDYFDQIAQQKRAFLDQDNFRDVAEANYNARKDYIDQNWSYMLTVWERGVYFDAGMFYGYVFDAIFEMPSEESVAEIEAKTETKTEIETCEMDSETSAQFSAGFLYGWSMHTVEERDYIVGCYDDERQSAETKLEKAFASFEEGDIYEGNFQMKKWLHRTRVAMDECDDVQDEFAAIARQRRRFMRQDNWERKAEQNYEDNKDFVDQQWDNMMDSWERGVYFDAGMFYAYSFN